MGRWTDGDDARHRCSGAGYRYRRTRAPPPRRRPGTSGTGTSGGGTSRAAPTLLAALRALPHRVALLLVALSGLAMANGIAFVLVRPDVNDLWAARARASAVSHGVGLTYWFSWFGGGSTPGNYSVVTPYLSAYLGTEVVGALASVAVSLLAVLLVVRTRHPVAASAIAVFVAAANLWSGRVPFLLGLALAAGALLALTHRRRVVTLVLTVLSMAASPVAGVFLALGLSGTFLTTRTRHWRPIIAWTAGTMFVAGVVVTLMFGAPGPEPFSAELAAGVLAGLLALWLARPPDHVRTTLYVAALADVVLWVVPNGLGSNFARFVWFCLPIAVVALSRRRGWVAGLLVTPLVLTGATTTVSDLYNASRPVSGTSYYTALAHRLRQIPDLQDYRVEVVDHGAHAGYDALLPYASLARGWETQEDDELNKSLDQNPLPATTYKVWLDNNAVGYVALPSASVGAYPEYTLVREHRAPYLHQIWSDTRWQLFAVTDPVPIVGTPGTIAAHTQSSMTVRIPCACTISVRVRWSKFLDGALLRPKPKPGVRPLPPVSAVIRNDGSGWTTVTTTTPGSYLLRGSIRGLLR